MCWGRLESFSWIYIYNLRICFFLKTKSIDFLVGKVDNGSLYFSLVLTHRSLMLRKIMQGYIGEWTVVRGIVIMLIQSILFLQFFSVSFYIKLTNFHICCVPVSCDFDVLAIMYSSRPWTYSRFGQAFKICLLLKVLFQKYFWRIACCVWLINLKSTFANIKAAVCAGQLFQCLGRKNCLLALKNCFCCFKIVIFSLKAWSNTSIF